MEYRATQFRTRPAQQTIQGQKPFQNRVAIMILNMAIPPLPGRRAGTSNLASRYFGIRRTEMVSLGLFVRLEAKPGKEREVAAFLKQGLEMANHEATTELWFALRLGPSTFAIFDA